MSKITTTLSGINPQPRNKREEWRNWQKLSALFLGTGDVALTPNGNISIGCNIHVFAPSYLIVTGNPGGANLLTSVSGTLTLSSATESQNTFLAGGASASGLTPSFRLITATDLAASPGAGTVLTSATTGAMTWTMPSTGSGGGAISSITLTVPSQLLVTGSPLTTSGTLAISNATESQNTVWAAGATASGLTPTFRLLQAIDLAASPGAATILRSNTDGTMTWATIGGVTTLSIVSANGLAGSVANPTTTPAVTLSTTITGVLKGNGTAISAAANSDLPAMTATVGGAVPTPPNNTTTFLRGDGTFAAAFTSTTVATIGTLSLTSLLLNGNVLGQLVVTTVPSGSAVSLTTATPANIGSLTLSPGLWDITGVVDYVLTAATTTDFKSGAGLVSATFGPQDSFVNMPLITSLLSDTFGHVLPLVALDNRTVSGSTPVYLIGQASFTVGAATAYGTLRARRVG